MGAHGMYSTDGKGEKTTREVMSTTRKERLFCGLTFLLFISTIIFMVLFIVYHDKYEDKKDKVSNEPLVCNTLDCVNTASELSQIMDLRVDPCQDFAQYTCGGFYRDMVIPSDKKAINHFSLLEDKNDKILRRIVEEDMKPNDADFTKKIKKFYKLCMDEESIEKIGVTPYKNSEEINDWPTVNPVWDVKTFDLTTSLVKYEKMFTQALFAYRLRNNMSNSDIRAFTLQQPSYGLLLENMKQERNSSKLMAYQQYYAEMAIALGADNVTAHQDAKALVDFEVELANISMTRVEKRRDQKALNNPMSLSDMSERFPYLDWPRVVRGIYSSIDTINVDDGLVVNAAHVKYFERLWEILNKTESRVIQNRISFKYARKIVPETSRRMRDIYIKFRKVVDGIKKEEPRWKQCLDRVSGPYDMGISKLFVMEAFSEDAKRYMIEMIDNVKESFRGILRNDVNWMSEATKDSAYKKLEKMRQKIGYPDNDFTFEDMNKKYEKFTVKDDFYHTSLETSLEEKRMNLRKLFQPVDHAEWMVSPSVVNAFYEPYSNAMNFPAGILQPIFFSSKYPSSINYGSIGMIIGHELTHGFDESGSQYDESGNVKNWWGDKDREEFLKRTSCLVDQYSSFRVDQVSLNVDGNRTLGENIADNGGIKESYRAYMRFSASRKETEHPLPGLGLTPEKQFFIAFARGFCFKQTDADMRNQVLNRPHSPAHYRIIGTVQNSEDFARVFGCKPGTPMNPIKKCSVW